jgi:valyl-tRNA synthetase
METGYDILFFWVARMIMGGLEFTDQVPFHTVYLHGLIRDENGRKMSKTYGNVIDPLVVMDELGTDALRFTLLVGSSPGNDMNLSLKKVEANRNFANKVWNASRFVLGALEQLAESQPSSQGTDTAPTLADLWIFARLATLQRDAERLFQNYQYGEAGRQIYDFFWNEFADWYVEIAKLQLSNEMSSVYTTARNLVQVLDSCLRLLHPYTPFVTEEIWGHLKAAASAVTPPIYPTHGPEWEEALIIAQWPEPASEAPWERQAVSDFSIVTDIVRSVRNWRAENNVKPSQRIPTILVGGEQTSVLHGQSGTIAALARLDDKHLTIVETLPEKPEKHIALVVGAVVVYLSMADLVDSTEQIARLEKDLFETNTQIERLEILLDGPFVEKAPPNVVEKEREKLAAYREKADKVKNQLEALSKN